MLMPEKIKSKHLRSHVFCSRSKRPVTKSEAFYRVKIDALLRDAGWTLDDGTSVLYEYT